MKIISNRRACSSPRAPRLAPVKAQPGVKSIFDFRFEDIVIEAYDPYPAIRAPIAV